MSRTDNMEEEISLNELDSLIAASKNRDSPVVDMNAGDIDEYTDGDHIPEYADSAYDSETNNNFDNVPATIEKQESLETEDISNGVYEEHVSEHIQDEMIEEDPEISRRPRWQIIIAVLVIMVLCVFFLLPGKDKSPELQHPVDVPANAPIDGQEPNPEQSVESLLNIGPEDIDPLESVKQHAVGGRLQVAPGIPPNRTQASMSSRALNETQIADTLGLLDESGQLIKVARKADIEELMGQISKIQSTIESQNQASSTLQSSVKALDSRLASLETRLSSFATELSDNQLEQKKREKPKIEVLYLVEPRDCVTCTAQAYIRNLDSSEEALFTEGDTLGAYKISIAGGRLILTNDVAQHAYFPVE